MFWIKKKNYCIIAVINPWTDIPMRLENMGYLNSDYCYISNMYDNIDSFFSLQDSFKYILARNSKNTYIRFSIITLVVKYRFLSCNFFLKYDILDAWKKLI